MLFYPIVSVGGVQFAHWRKWWDFLFVCEKIGIDMKGQAECKIKNRVGKIRKLLAHVVSGLVPNRAWRSRVRNIIQFGICRTISVYTKKNEKFPYFLAVAAIARDEGRYFKEWIDYHRLMGVEKFYIFDNESTDNTHEVLLPYIKSGIVEYHYVTGQGIQNEVNLWAVRNACRETRWLAVIDLDEFILPMVDKSIPDFLRRFSKNTAQILIRWCLYGSSGHVRRPDGLVLENYKYRKADNGNEANKMIVNPRMVVATRSAHAFSVIGRTVDENGRAIAPARVIPGMTQDIIRINHYRCKSWQDSQEKHNKGDVLYGKDYVRYTRADFDKFDTNDVYDDVMDKYVSQLKDMAKKEIA